MDACHKELRRRREGKGDDRKGETTGEGGRRKRTNRIGDEERREKREGRKDIKARDRI